MPLPMLLPGGELPLPPLPVWAVSAMRLSGIPLADVRPGGGTPAEGSGPECPGWPPKVVVEKGRKPAVAAAEGMKVEARRPLPPRGAEVVGEALEALDMRLSSRILFNFSTLDCDGGKDRGGGVLDCDGRGRGGG